MKTKLTELLNIKYHILQGAMAWVSEANLASAVSNAGGAKIIATGGREILVRETYSRPVMKRLPEEVMNLKIL